MAELMGGPPRSTPARSSRIEPLLDLPEAPVPARPRDDAPAVPPVLSAPHTPTPALAEDSGIFGIRTAPPASSPAPAQDSGIVEVRARPAALWQRITAFIVDGGLVCGVLALYVGLAAALIAPRGVPPTQLTGIDGLMARVHQLHAVLAPCVALALIIGLVYTAAFALLWNGRTPGRRLLGIRLVDRTGLAPAPGRAIARAARVLRH